MKEELLKCQWIFIDEKEFYSTLRLLTKSDQIEGHNFDKTCICNFLFKLTKKRLRLLNFTMKLQK